MLVSFKLFVESVEEGRAKLDNAPKLPHDQNWLSDYATKKYTDDPTEVSIKHGLGLKKVSDHPHTGKYREIKGKPSYSKTALQHVKLDDVHYTQPSVNVGKLHHFITNYHPDPKKIHKDGELREYDAPSVSKYVGGDLDGYIESSDHHRLIASHLRGDTHAIARVTTFEHAGGNNYRVVKTKQDKNIKQD